MKTPKPTARRHPYVAANLKRHASTTKSMKDRRVPRAGNRNVQRDYREERY